MCTCSTDGKLEATVPACQADLHTRPHLPDHVPLDSPSTKNCSAFPCWPPQHHTSNLFRDKRRVHAYSGSANDSASGSSEDYGGGEERVVSAQFANPRPQTAWDDSVPPFLVGHPKHVDKKVRIVHIRDFAGDDQPLNDNQVSELPTRSQGATLCNVCVTAVGAFTPGKNTRGVGWSNRRHVT